MINCLFFLFAGIVISLFLNKILLKFASTLGVKNDGEIVLRWSNQTKPAIGGIPFFVLFLLSAVGFVLIFGETDALFETKLGGLFLACGVAFLLGFSDDAYNTKPLLKFSAQVLCAIILIYTDTYINVSSNMILNYMLTIVWIIGIMNSINMLDNMDAITTVTSIFILIDVLIILYFKGLLFTIESFIILGVLSAMFGFLYYNWHPAKMFMGDTGSQFLGMFLGAISIEWIWNYRPEVLSLESQTQQLTLVLLAFSLPIIDTTTVTINRLRRRQSPFVGGRDHTTHNLSYLGVSDNHVALIFSGISVVSTIMILTIVSSIDSWSYSNFVIFFSYFVLIFVFLYGTTQITKAKEKFQEYELKRKKQSPLRIEFREEKPKESHQKSA